MSTVLEVGARCAQKYPSRFFFSIEPVAVAVDHAALPLGDRVERASRG